LIDKKILNNGIVLMSEYLPYVQSAAVGVWTRAGAVDETRETAGISHLIEHMLFKGTESHSAKEIAETIDRMGGLINAFTGKEATCYYVKSLSEHLGESIDLLADIFLNSVFDEVELEKEKKVIFEEMSMVEDNPEDFGHDLLDESVFDGAPLGNRILGYRDTVGKISADDIRAYMSERYAAGNIVISVAGNFDESGLADRVETAFGGAAPGRFERALSGAPHKPSFTSRTKDIEQSHILLGRRGVHLTSDDYYAFSLFNGILGGSMSSRLFQSIREEKGLAYSVYSMSSSFVDDGIFMIYAGVGEGNERVAIDAIAKETSLLADGGAFEDELLKVKEQYKGHYVFGRESVQTRMAATGKNELLTGRVYEPGEIIAGIEAVTRDDIARIAKGYADISDYTAVVISGGDELSASELGLQEKS
jgi:predicted Zn-dependent peptidase